MIAQKLCSLFYKEDGVAMVWHYNAFLSYEPEPVEEKRIWLDQETANLKQVDLLAYFLANGMPSEDAVIEQTKLTEGLYANALALWKEDPEEKKVLDKRA